MSLEKTAEHAHDGKNKDRRRHDAKRQGTAGAFKNHGSDEVGTAEEQDGHQAACEYAKGNSAAENLPGVFIPLFHLFLGNQLGNSERKAVRGEDQADIIDLIGRIVITDPLIAENACHGYFIKESDQADNDAGGRQDRPLHQEIGFISFLLLWHGKIPPIICLSKQAETSSILLYISSLVYIYFSFWENLPEGKGKAEKIL